MLTLVIWALNFVNFGAVYDLFECCHGTFSTESMLANELNCVFIGWQVSLCDRICVANLAVVLLYDGLRNFLLLSAL